jgi:hypothetical protein
MEFCRMHNKKNLIWSWFVFLWCFHQSLAQWSKSSSRFPSIWFDWKETSWQNFCWTEATSTFTVLLSFWLKTDNADKSRKWLSSKVQQRQSIAECFYLYYIFYFYQRFDGVHNELSNCDFSVLNGEQELIKQCK